MLATGHREDRVKLALANSGLEVHFCYNQAYERTQNAVSLALCRRALGDTAFFKLDGDVFFEPEVLQRLDSSPGSLAVAVDSSRQADAEAMKVRTSAKGGIVAFGKALSSAESAGETLGIERISQGACPKLFDALDAAVRAGLDDLYYEDVYSTLIGAGSLDALAVEVGDLGWAEIDDFSDLERAERLAAGIAAPPVPFLSH